MQTLEFPGGELVQIDFDHEGHSYQVRQQIFDDQWTNWRPTTGVTTPLSKTVVHEFIKPWVAKEVSIAALCYARDHPNVIDEINDLEADTEAYSKGFTAEDDVLKPNGKVDIKKGSKLMTYYRYNKKYPYLKEIKAAPDLKSTEGKELGTWIHAAIEEFYKSDRKTLPINTAFTQGMWDSFQQFDNYYKPVPDKDGLEFFVYSLRFGYSGQGDFRGSMFNGNGILDWKSTNRSPQNPDGITVEYFYQLGGLAYAEYERTNKWPDFLGAVNLDKNGGEPIVILSTDFNLSVKDAAMAYISHYNTFKVHDFTELKFKRRS